MSEDVGDVNNKLNHLNIGSSVKDEDDDDNYGKRYCTRNLGCVLQFVKQLAVYSKSLKPCDTAQFAWLEGAVYSFHFIIKFAFPFT